VDSGATTAPAGVDNPQPPKEERTCTKCEARKVVTPETWPYRKGREGRYQAHGGVCLECDKKRKAVYDERRKAIAAGIIAPAGPEEGKPDEKRSALVKASKLDVARALKAGSNTLNHLAPSVMARVMEYLEDPEHKHHLWALELLAQRILPRKLYEELGGQAAGVGALGDKRPMFVLNVLPAGPGASAEGQVYDQEGNVQLLAAPRGNEP
jgi:hypothetical protein